MAPPPGLRLALLCAALLPHGGGAVDLTAARRGSERQESRAVAIASDGSAEEPPTAPRLQDPALILGMKHVSKAGGSFLINIMNAMTPNFKRQGTRKFFPKYFQEYPTPRENFHEWRPKLFVVSSVRNPCDWYVSQWAFASQFDGEALRQKLGTDLFGDLKNKSKFAEWLLWSAGARGASSLQAWQQAHPGPHFGVMSLRFWESFVADRSDFPQTAGNPGYDTTALDEFSLSYGGRRDVQQGLGNFTAAAGADCWVHVESYMADLRACLREYEARSGTLLDWASFEQEASAERSNVAEDEDGKAIDHNDSVHRHCESYYTPELAALVMKFDAPLFRTFGYSKCCGPATGAPPMSARPAPAP